MNLWDYFMGDSKNQKLRARICEIDAPKVSVKTLLIQIDPYFVWGLISIILGIAGLWEFTK